jgi:hypothetical protein
MKTVKDKINSLKEELKNYLLENISKWGVESVGQHTTTFLFNDISFQVWSANEVHDRSFYGNVYGMSMEGLEYTEIECEKLQEKIDIAKSTYGITRDLKQTILGNDLFFSFDGVYGAVKFSGYNDNNWWGKYKPLTVKEDDNIVWEINWDRMEVKYLSNGLN